MGRAFVFGDNIDTDVIAPGAYLALDPEDMKGHCLEAVRPDFAGAVRQGDVLVAGENFGLGSSRELAASALRALGIEVVLARSVARIFYRNAINLGLAVLEWPEGFAIEEGDALAVDPREGVITNHTRGTKVAVRPLNDRLLAIVEAGGLIPLLQKKRGLVPS